MKLKYKLKHKVMKLNLFCLFFLVIYMTTSCTEDYQLPNVGTQTTLVITGLITNEPGPYYVKVTENVSEISTGKTKQRGINDARVTVTDNNGNVDELRSFFSVSVDSVLTYSGTDYTGTPYDVYNYFIDIPDGNGDFVRFSVAKDYDAYLPDFREGAYFTTSTKGVSGNTYTLKVEYTGKEYTATDYMCYGTVIDSLSLEPVGIYIYDKIDDDDGFLVPCLYFAEPKEEVNFYMFRVTASVGLYFGGLMYEYRPAKDLLFLQYLGGGADWPISVVSDRFMPPYVYQYKMSDGDFEQAYLNGTDMGFYHMNWGMGGVVDMYCVSEQVYRYYYALSMQYYEDGGAFSPSPGSPPTNISGGAQGCFSAASVSRHLVPPMIYYGYGVE